MTKIISISDDAYNALKRLKRESSFTEIILELARRRKAAEIMKFAGTLTEEEGEKMKEEIYKERRRPSRRFP